MNLEEEYEYEFRSDITYVSSRPSFKERKILKNSSRSII